MFEFLIAHFGAVAAISMTFASAWSFIRFRSFDIGCAIAAFAGAFGVYYAVDEYVGLSLVANNLKALGGGALLGCLAYDLLKTSLA